jgi:tRNA-dihydrouridine synthase B
MQIGPYLLRNRLIVAPMAGVTDRPFRQLCKAQGAAMAVSEMISSKPELWQSNKSLRRADHCGEVEPVSVQIAGADPGMMAQAARHNADRGAQIIDINMGCPAKKVCNVMAGSALLRDEALVARILRAVVGAVDVPVTLKIRTGWSPDRRNACNVARIAQESGIRALAIHGRTRACGFEGRAEYDTIAEVKAAVMIPVIANGDIDSPRQARRVLDYTGADAIMIGRAAQGRPWIFRAMAHYLETGEPMRSPSSDEIHEILRSHLMQLYAFYGEVTGVRVARKHIGWTLRSAARATGLPGADALRARINALETSDEQLNELDRYFGSLADCGAQYGEVEEEIAA